MSTGKNLIFLISQPRSGSTLLQKILAGHSSIHTVSEPWIALHPLLALRQRGVSHYHSHALAREATLDFLSYVPGGEDTYFDSVRLMLSHLYEAALAPSGKSLFLDKTPRYYFIVPELRRVFPDARFVFLIRNPLAVLSSILETWVDPPLPGRRTPLRLDLLHDLLTAPEVLAQARASATANTAVVQYERLVASPAVEMERLCTALGLPFDPKMVDYGAGAAAGKRWAFGDQNTVYTETRPIPTRAGRWKESFAAIPAWNEMAHAYLAALGPATIGRMGYNFAELEAALKPVESSCEPQTLLGNAIVTPAYGETSGIASQISHFQELLRRAKPLHRATLRAVAG